MSSKDENFEGLCEKIEELSTKVAVTFKKMNNRAVDEGMDPSKYTILPVTFIFGSKTGIEFIELVPEWPGREDPVKRTAIMKKMIANYIEKHGKNLSFLLMMAEAWAILDADRSVVEKYRRTDKSVRELGPATEVIAIHGSTIDDELAASMIEIVRDGIKCESFVHHGIRTNRTVGDGKIRASQGILSDAILYYKAITSITNN